MHRLRHAAMLFIAALLTSTALSAFASDLENRVGKLESEVNDMQQKLDLILKAVGGNSTQEQSQNFEPAPVMGNKPGLTLNLAVIDADQTVGHIINDPGNNLVASEIIESPSDFSYKQFLAVQSMQGYAKLSGQFVGQLWTGILTVPEAGGIDFVAEILTQQINGYDPIDCIAKVSIDRQVVVSTSRQGIIFDSMVTGRGTAQLSAGRHEFSFWTFCSRKHDGIEYDKIGFSLKMKLPSDRGPKPIPMEYLSPG